MTRIHDEQHQAADIVVCQTAASADFVVATLAANGVVAHAAYTRGPFPSVDWAEGYRVTVPSDAEEEARRVLAALSGRDDIAPLGDGEDTG